MWHGCRTELADAQNRATAEYHTARRAEAALGSAEELSCSEAGQVRHVAAMREELNVAQRKGRADLEWFRAQMGALEAQVAQGLKREEALQVEVAEAARAPSPPVSAPLAPPGLTPAPGLASYVGAAPIAAPFARPDDAIGSPLGPVRGQWTNVPIAPGVPAGRPDLGSDPGAPFSTPDGGAPPTFMSGPPSTTGSAMPSWRGQPQFGGTPSVVSGGESAPVRGRCLSERDITSSASRAAGLPPAQTPAAEAPAGGGSVRPVSRSGQGGHK